VNKNIYDQIGQASRKHSKALKKLTEPLHLFLGVDRFWRNFHRADGFYSVVGNHPPTAEAFFGQQLYLGHPYFRNPLFFKSGYVLPELFNDKDYETTQGKLKKEGECFHVFIVFQKKDKDLLEYGFACSKWSPGFEVRYLNHLHAINRFIDYFEVAASKIIKEAEECGINIARVIGDKYDERPKIAGNIMTPEQELLFLASMDTNPKRAKLILSLSKSERNCLRPYLTGCTTKEIAKAFYRSPRTIETHIESAKQKLGLNTRSELFEFLRSYRDVL
jgi:DNA-binding CsgD family transcriptional regulator